MKIYVKKGQSFNLKKMRLWGKEHFLINEEYQRSKIWNDKKQQLLLDSIIKDLPIGTFILKKNNDNSFEVLDGQQRIGAIFRFMSGDLGTSPDTKEFPEKKYEELEADPTLSANFDSFEIFYDEVEGGTDQQIAQIFLRLQEGVPLNAAEKLNATIGKMRNFIFETSKHPLFKKGVKISEFRFAHRLITAQITLLELESDFEHIPYPEFPNLRFPELQKMYRDYETNLPGGLHRRVYGTLDTIFNCLRDDSRVIRKKSDLPLVYLMATHLRKKYVLDFRLFRDFIINFFTKVAQVRSKEGEFAINIYERYVELRKKGLTHSTFSERFRILLGLFLNESSNIQLKDQKRSFDVGQKLAIFYYKNTQICQYCNKEVVWDEADFHHIKFHSKGGLTTVDNGQLMHITCHRKFHEKEGVGE